MRYTNWHPLYVLIHFIYLNSVVKIEDEGVVQKGCVAAEVMSQQRSVSKMNTIHEALLPIFAMIMDQDLCYDIDTGDELPLEKNPWNIIYTNVLHIVEGRIPLLSVEPILESRVQKLFEVVRGASLTRTSVDAAFAEYEEMDAVEIM